MYTFSALLERGGTGQKMNVQDLLAVTVAVCAVLGFVLGALINVLYVGYRFGRVEQKLASLSDDVTLLQTTVFTRAGIPWQRVSATAIEEKGA